MSVDSSAVFLDAARHRLAEGTRKIEHCAAQLSDEQLWWRPRPEMNSIANLMLHLSGNVRQWLVSGLRGDPDVRNHPNEFSDRSGRTKAQLLAILKSAVADADAALSRLAPDQLISPRRIQGFETNVTDAIFDCLCHFNGHVQEIIHLTRSQLGDRYKFDFIPRGPQQESAGERG